MQLLNPKRLADDLRNDSVSEVDKYRFALVSIFLSMFLGTGSGVFTARPTYSYLLGLILTGIISFVGLRACFKVNERGDNQKFLDRYLCLSVPLLIWSYLLYAGLFCIIYIVAFYVWGQSVARLFVGATPVTMAFSIIMSIAYFSLLHHFMGKASM